MQFSHIINMFFFLLFAQILTKLHLNKVINHMPASLAVFALIIISHIGHAKLQSRHLIEFQDDYLLDSISLPIINTLPKSYSKGILAISFPFNTEFSCFSGILFVSFLRMYSLAENKKWQILGIFCWEMITREPTIILSVYS